MGYAPLIKSQRIRLFNGLNWYVNGTDGNDTNSGVSPEKAFKTIGAATAYLVANSREGDRINVFAGTYVENVVLSKNATELWCDIGVTLDGAATCLTVSGIGCLVHGDIIVTPASDTIGVLVSGTYNVLDAKIRVKGAANTTGVSVTGDYNALTDVKASNVKATGKCFNIDGNATHLDRCVAVGTTTSYGFFFNASKTVGLVRNCISSGNQTSGFYLEDDTVTGIMFDNCVSGAGDGPRKQGLTGANTWSNWSFEDSVVVTATITTSSGAQVIDLFKVTGSVLIKRITGHVTIAVTAGVTAVQLVLQDTGTTVQITKNDGVLSSMPVGTLLAKTGDASKTIEISSAAACSIMDEVDPKKESFRATQMTADVLTKIQMLVTAADAAQSGAVHWHIEYEQITESSQISLV